MAQAVRHLADLGHRHIALVRHAQRVRPGLERERAFRRALKARRLKADWIVRVSRSDDEPEMDTHLFTAVNAPTALLVEGTRLLRSVLAGLRASGLRVPEDRSLIGIDTLDALTLTTPETTTIVRDFRAIGRAAASLMVRRLAEPDLPPQRLLLDSRLQLMGSCGPPVAPGITQAP
jgi:DNA-binding LacI/PurR family transcriptional regulator